jgi:orotate phosphoribosyltransferase
MSDERDILYPLLRDYAYRHHPQGIRLASGIMSEHYFNAKEVLCRREGGLAFARWALQAIEGLGVRAVGGLEIGAVPPAAAISALSPAEAPLDCFIVRKKPKEHGLGNKIEGILPRGSRVAIIEDVVTSGGSALQAIEAVEAAGSTVSVILALVDRQEGTLEPLKKYPLRAAFTLPEFLARRAGEAK